MALAADRDTEARVGSNYSYPMAASKEIFEGALVVLDASGNAEPGTTATGKIVAGRAEEYKNNTGAAAAKNIEVRDGIFKWANSSGDAVTKANIGDAVFIEDDQTVCATGTGKSTAGIMRDIDSDGVWVETRAPVSSLGLLAANNLSDVGTAATARSNLGVDVHSLVMRVTNLVGADTAVYRLVSPVAGDIDTVYSILEGAALAGGDATITLSIGGTPVTGGAITITQSGSAEGDIDTVSPSAAKTLAVGDAIEATVGGTNTDTDAFAEITLLVTLA